MDIAYLPMARGFVSLAAVVDWFSRRVLSWRVSITLEAGFCVEPSAGHPTELRSAWPLASSALEEALARHGKPDIVNTDQGSQFTSQEFTGEAPLGPWSAQPIREGSGGVMLAAGIAVSMEGKGSWRDNVFVERLWRSVKYEKVYLRAYSSVGEARASIGRYLTFYNGHRPHSSLDRQTLDQAYLTRLPQSAAA